MGKCRFAIIGGLLAVWLLPCERGQADVIVYKESCGHNADVDWNLVCKVDKNTFRDTGVIGTGIGYFKDVESITICAPFGNRGGLGPLTIVYNSGGGSQFTPAHVFETVKYRGSRLEGKVSWAGTSPRFGSNFKAQAELSYDAKKDAFAYNEILSSGNGSIGELRAAKCTRFFAEEMTDGIELPRKAK